MPKYIATIILVAIFLAIATSQKTENGLDGPVEIANGCFVYAFDFKMAVQALQIFDEHIWSRVLGIFFFNGTGHAVTVFVYKNKTFIYDPNIGTYVAANYPIYDPIVLAEIAYPEKEVRKAVYYEPTLLLNPTQRSRILYAWERL